MKIVGLVNQLFFCRFTKKLRECYKIKYWLHFC